MSETIAGITNMKTMVNKGGMFIEMLCLFQP